MISSASDKISAPNVYALSVNQLNVKMLRMSVDKIRPCVIIKI
nr:MAG TPA: hypothetical protein [Caudoviricetes sp.]